MEKVFNVGDTVELDWRDNIPLQGALCWVSDQVKNPSSNDIDSPIVLIIAYEPRRNNPFQGKFSAWKYATPLTQEEANERISDIL
jgi:hypothetical protein